MEGWAEKVEKPLQPLKDAGIVDRVTWSSGGYGTNVSDTIRVIVNGEPEDHRAEIEALLTHLPARISIVRKALS